MSLPLILGLLMILVVLIALSKGQVSFGSRETEDFEARLRPLNPSGVAGQATGKAEREAWTNGNAEFEAWVRGLELPDGEDLEFVINGTTLGTAEVRGGHARLEYDSRLGDDVPPVGIGQLLEVVHRGNVLMIGHFTED